MGRTLRLPRQSWAAILWRTLRHMAVAVIASVAVSYLILETFSQGIGETGLIASIVAPMVLGGPMIFFMSLKHQELQFAYEKLEAAAARDSLTGCLHHGAFVEATGPFISGPDAVGGALLVIDADHFKSINDRFGHASGDTALKLIANAIRQSVGPSDLVGRLGGEEFGIFMPGADAKKARSVGENLRLSVRKITFDAPGQPGCLLSVSIGGAVTKEAMVFNDLFRTADARLYAVKETGRNNCDVVVMPPRPANEANPPENHNELMYRGQRVVKA